MGKKTQSKPTMKGKKSNTTITIPTMITIHQKVDIFWTKKIFHLEMLLRIFILIIKIGFYLPLIFLGQKDLYELISYLGPIYIKLCQIITTRPDVFGKSLVYYLKPLQDKVAPSNLIPHIDNFIIETKPIACGSIAEVYNCEIDGQIRVVKIKRKNVDQHIQTDKQILNFLMNEYLITYLWGKGMVTHSKRILGLIYDTIDKHLDFNQEVNNIEIMSDLFKGSQVKIPEVHRKYSDNNHIVMEKILGVPFSDLPAENLNRFISIFLHATYEMIFVHHYVHGDIHEGNILVMEDKIAFIDFGIIHRISPDKVLLLRAFFLSLSSLNSYMLATFMYTNHTDKTHPYTNFQSDIERLMLICDSTNLYHFLNELINICHNNKLEIEESLLYPFLILIEADGIALKYSKDLTMSKIIFQRI